MKIVGIVAEYNPFHKGHAYQIKRIREILGDDTGIVCVMSGDFVQRGEPALFSKYARAEAAVRCGADLVIELPVHCSIASAERFAGGAVQLLGKLGVVDYLAFGSESANMDAIQSTAFLLDTPAFQEAVVKELENGCSYPAARSLALKALQNSNVTDLPNDNLGVEYVRAINRFGFSMEPMAIKRVGAMHDQNSDSPIKSGSEIRSVAKTGLSIGAHVPDPAWAVYVREMQSGCGPVFPESLEQAILSRLRFLPEAVFSELPDAAEGLENRLFKACRRCSSLDELYDTVKSKRYAHARIRRMVMCAALGVTKSDHERENLYARVLALNERGAKILRRSEDTRSVSVISKAAAGRQLPSSALSIFQKTAEAHDLYVLGYPNADYRHGEADWKTSPVFIG